MSVMTAFDRAVDYDRHAIVQARVAGELADTIAAQPLRPDPRVLEIGCGTGLLGAALIDSLPGSHWLMTDIAPAMVARTATRFGKDARVRTAVMDGENPTGDNHYDLICSSLAMQWFGDLAGSVARLRRRLAPDGLLAFTTLAEGSFAEWGAAHASEASGLHEYPSKEELEAMELNVTIQHHPIRHPDARQFLIALKAIGAGTARAGHIPLTPPALRRVMARFEAAGSTATYVVATCLLRGESA